MGCLRHGWLRHRGLRVADLTQQLAQLDHIERLRDQPTWSEATLCEVAKGHALITGERLPLNWLAQVLTEPGSPLVEKEPESAAFTVSADTRSVPARGKPSRWARWWAPWALKPPQFLIGPMNHTTQKPVVETLFLRAATMGGWIANSVVSGLLGIDLGARLFLLGMVSVNPMERARLLVDPLSFASLFGTALLGVTGLVFWRAGLGCFRLMRYTFNNHPPGRFSVAQSTAWALSPRAQAYLAQQRKKGLDVRNADIPKLNRLAILDGVWAIPSR